MSRKWKKSFDLVTSSILLTSAIISIYLTIRPLEVSNYRQTRRINSQILYIFLVKFSCAIVSFLTGLICLVASLNRQLNRCCLLTGVILAVMSTFGSLMTGAIAIFQDNWRNHIIALEKTIRLSLCIFIFGISIYLSVVLTFKFRAIDHFDYHSTAVTPLWQHDGENVMTTVPLIVTLIMVSGGTAILGFTMGVIIPSSGLSEADRRTSILIVNYGGLHSGVLAVTTGSMGIITGFFCYKRRAQMVTSSLFLAILTVISSCISFYTEEGELQEVIANYQPNSQRNALIPSSVYHTYLAKSTLVMFANIFCLVFVSPLIACLSVNLPFAWAIKQRALIHRYEQQQALHVQQQASQISHNNHRDSRYYMTTGDATQYYPDTSYNTRPRSPDGEALAAVDSSYYTETASGSMTGTLTKSQKPAAYLSGTLPRYTNHHGSQYGLQNMPAPQQQFYSVDGRLYTCSSTNQLHG